MCACVYMHVYMHVHTHAHMRLRARVRARVRDCVWCFCVAGCIKAHANRWGPAMSACKRRGPYGRSHMVMVIITLSNQYV